MIIKQPLPLQDKILQSATTTLGHNIIRIETARTEARYNKGVNARQATVTITWNALSRAEYEQLIAFWNEFGKTKSFAYTDIDTNVTLAYLFAEPLVVTNAGCDYYDVSTTIQQVYDYFTTVGVPSPTPTRTVTPTPTPTPTVTVTPTPSVTASFTPTPTVTATAAVTPSATPAVTPTMTVTPTFTPSVTPTRTVTPTPTATITPTVTPTFTPTASITPTPGVSATATPTVTPTRTVTPTPTVTPTFTPTASITPSVSFSPTPTVTPTFTPTPSITPTRTITPTPTVTPTVTPTFTPTPSVTPTRTITPTPTVTPTRTVTPTPTPSSAGSSNHTAVNSPTSDTQTALRGDTITLNVSVNVTGGTGPFNYLWFWQSGGTGITIDNSTLSTCILTASTTTGPTTQIRSGTLRCTVTDTGNSSYQTNSDTTISWTFEANDV